MKFLNSAKVKKLVAGKTVWRCQIQENGTVNVEEILLIGSKTQFKLFYSQIVTKIGNNFLNDLISVPCFSRRSDAIYFRDNVDAPQFASEREHAENHWGVIYDWSDYDYDYQ